jgi:F like protein
MTQPIPAAAAQQQAAVEVFAQYEPQLYAAYLEMMVEWLAAVKTAMFAGGIVSLGLVPDPLTVFSQTPKWNSLTEKYAEDVAREVLAAPFKNLFANDTIFETRPFVRNWIASHANRLQQVPDEVYGLVSHVIDSATTNGASITDVQDQIEKLFSDTGTETWKNRARTVARTEVVGAYNGGLNDAFAMIVEADPETVYVKRWLATEDHRTRPDHVKADGQVVPFSQPFDVGGYPMMYPHDPAGPPQEVINCRCTMLLEVEGEPTDMSNKGYKNDLAAAGFPRSMSLMQFVCTDGQFCMQTHKPGLCKGQKRGQTEPGVQDETKKNPTQVAQVAVKGLTQAISQAQAVATANAIRNPKLAAMARKAAADYAKALRPHEQTLRDAARANARAKSTANQDTRQQDALDKRAAKKRDTLDKRAAAIVARRREAARVAKMSKKQRAAYGKAKSAQAKAKHVAAENKVLKEAAKA